MTQPQRPLLRYHGGKWPLAAWIAQHFPPHRVYVEPFAGGASVLLRKEPSPVEVYNDLDAEIVNLFRVARERGPELRQALELTPFSRQEFDLAWEPADDPLERARRVVVRAGQGRDTASATMPPERKGRSTWRNYTGPDRWTAAVDWVRLPAALDAITTRLRGVLIENDTAEVVIERYDGDDTLFYVDPPYIRGARDRGQDYRHELDDAAHERLARQLFAVRGAVVLSGYDNDIYNGILRGWWRVERNTHADGALDRTEVLWLSPSVGEPSGQLDLL